MRTQDEIVARIEERRKFDSLGFEVDEYFEYLDFDHAKSYLKDSVTREQWNKNASVYTEESVKKTMIDYLDFAFGKAEDERGISACRSLQHYQAWLWLLDDQVYWNDKAIDELIHYDNYGIDHLKRIEKYLK